MEMHIADIRETQFLIESALRHSSRDKVADRLGWSRYMVDKMRKGEVQPWQLNQLREALGFDRVIASVAEDAE